MKHHGWGNQVDNVNQSRLIAPNCVKYVEQMAVRSLKP
jgi:hypothetical protein